MHVQCKYRFCTDKLDSENIICDLEEDMDRLVAWCVLMPAAMDSASAWTQLSVIDRNRVLDKHNELRSKEGAANMDLMVSCRNHNFRL